MPNLKQASKKRQQAKGQDKASEETVMQKKIQNDKKPTVDPKKSLAAQKAAKTRALNKQKEKLGLTLSKTEQPTSSTALAPVETPSALNLLSTTAQKALVIAKNGGVVDADTYVDDPDYNLSSSEIAVKSERYHRITENAQLKSEKLQAERALMEEQIDALKNEQTAIKQVRQGVKNNTEQVKLEGDIADNQTARAVTKDKQGQADYQEQVTEINHQIRGHKLTVKQVELKTTEQKAQTATSRLASKLKMNTDNVIDAPYTPVSKTSNQEPQVTQ